MKCTLSLATAAILATAMVAPVQAARIKDNVIFDVENTFEDQSREVVVDVDGSNSLSNGDVFLGFLRLDDRTVPTGLSLGNEELYAAFSLTVTNLTLDNVNSSADLSFAATTQAGLQLQDVTGDAAVSNSALTAVYSDIGANLIVTNTTTGTGDILTQTSAVSNGTFEFSAGLVDALDGFVQSGEGVFNLASANGLLPLNFATIGGGLGAGNAIQFGAGLSIIQNESGLGFNPSVSSTDLGGSLHQLVLANGSFSGACNILNSAGDADCSMGMPASTNYLFGQIGGFNYYGLTDNLDATVDPFDVPEPSVLALLAIGMLGMGGTAARRNKR